MIKDFNYSTLEQVLDLHETAVRLFGGRFPIHDFTLLHSAIERPNTTFGGVDLYPDIYTKAAAFIQSLIINHPFDDGNKRTAILTTALFFHLNGYQLNVEKFSDETYDFVVGIDLKSFNFAKTVSWFRKHVRKASQP